MTEVRRFYDITICPPGKAEGSDEWNDYSEYLLEPTEDLDGGRSEFADYEEMELTEILIEGQ